MACRGRTWLTHDAVQGDPGVLLAHPQVLGALDADDLRLPHVGEAPGDVVGAGELVEFGDQRGERPM